MKARTTVPASIQLQGIRLTNIDSNAAVDAIDAAIHGETPTRIAFVNADCVNIAARNPAYQEHLARMDWVFTDGIGLRIAGRLLRQPVRDNVNGTDLFPLLCARLAAQGRRLYLLGGQPGVAQAAANWACINYPGLRIAGTQHGYYPPEQEAQVLAHIWHSQADVLLVGFGCPRQEQWIAQHHAATGATGATVIMGVGGLFDYYSGRIPRAPYWMRQRGLEWAFRLYQEPRRLWRRYLLGNGQFLARMIATRCTAAWQKNSLENPS